MNANLRSMLKGHLLEFVVSFPNDINKFTDYFHGKHDSLTDESSDVFGELELVEDDLDMDAEDASEDYGGDAEGVVVKVANRIIEEAYARNASDIHIESLVGKRGALVRFRVDGECSNFQTIPFNYKKALVSRIKILSRLDIAEKRLPQDGKIKFRTRRGRNIELRVATLPTVGGNEDVVMRILAGGDSLPLKKMGLHPDNLENFKALIERPYGLVLVVGPTGSGKTTTLHAGLGYINRPEKKIWTAEDPVEIVQDGLRQVQVLPKIKLDFARVLRAFLRADPDVIMVGETRDEETANTVIEAALTGHLVFSTLHTNSAPETVTRLLGMGIDPFNFADSLLGVLAQRLIKRLCPHCRQPYQPDQEEIDTIIKEYGNHPTKPLQLEKGATLYRARGCVHCQKSGFKGRLAIHELLITDDNMRTKIEKNAPVADIRMAAMLAGMRTLKQDGIIKVINGDTDLHQVSSATMK
ncbi:MAG: GspE/PulE family protein [Proteobacteria bacterium]|nr:GspE/PulE family protein [Pseudomonadota bacterium]MBU1738105.1 GspE/PulE family protein [Pseudomonadota bacterium]